MTPDQQAALRADILSRCSPDLLASRDTQAIAAQISAGRTRREPTEIGNGAILETIGLPAGNALLDLINSAPDFRHVKPLLEQGRLRVDSPLVRGTLASLVPGVLTAEQSVALLALAERPDPVSEYDVRCVAWADTGEWLL